MEQEKSSKKKDDMHAFEIDFYENVLKESPDFKDALKALAELYTKTGSYEKGLNIDIKLSRILPNEEIVHYNLACSYSLVGDIDRALGALKKSIKLGYVDFGSMNKDPDLENLRKDERFKEITMLNKRLDV